jgi:predicted DNA-binding transcriptional regulator AlpA
MTESNSKLRPPAAAKYLQLAASTLAKMRGRGDGPAFMKIGTRVVLYDRADLDTWLLSLRRKGSGSTRA